MSGSESAMIDGVFREPDEVFNMFLPAIVQTYKKSENGVGNRYGIIPPEPHPIVNDLGEHIEISIPTTTIPTGGGVNIHPTTIMERDYLLTKEVFVNQVNMYQELRDRLVH